ncbi:hypothetical protein MMC21_007882 [Puttea exsequens]|nr:hypothetical protein [Puttea exsequens]
MNAHLESRIRELSGCLKSTNEGLRRAENRLTGQWKTVGSLADLLRYQIHGEQEVDVSRLFYEKEKLSYEIDALNESVSQKQNAVDILRQDLERAKADSFGDFTQGETILDR